MTNSWGVDTGYFERELKSLLRTLDNRTPGELYRYFLALADVALPAQPKDKGSAGQQQPTKLSRPLRKSRKAATSA